MPILETMSGVTMPADYSFECINNFVHRESPEYKDLQYLALGMSSYIEKLEAQIAAQEQTINHWKSNHDHMVTKAAFLSQRPDLPDDRIPAYRELEQLRAQISATTPQPAAQAGQELVGYGVRNKATGKFGSWLYSQKEWAEDAVLKSKPPYQKFPSNEYLGPILLYAAQPAPADNVRGKQ